MEVRLLGPLELLRDGVVVDVRGAGERALLAFMASAPGRVLTSERLIDALWAHEPPANPQNALQLRVSKLRKVVGEALVTVPAGYRLDLTEQDVDAARFESLLRERRYAEALALWRGDPLAEFTDQPWAAAEAARLDELHATALEEHIDERLAAGEHVALVAELERLIASRPLRDRLRGQHMLALYRSGRTGDALAVYQAFRRLLDEELGVGPSAELRALEVAILREDPSLEGPPSVTVTGNVPAPVSSVIGRDGMLDRLSGDVASSRLVSLTGPGGVGKTTLAVALARRLQSRFTDGAWFVPLAAIDDGDRVADVVADALGLSDPDRSSTERMVTAWLAPRRALIVLDNCEHLTDACAAFIDRLLRAAGDDLRVLTTSREALGVGGELQVPVPPLDGADAVRLFTERALGVGAHRSLEQQHDAIARICERLDGIPLAVELAAARAKSMTPEQIADRLDDRFRLLTLAPRTAATRHQTLRATIDWSHDLLDERQQILFRRLAVFRRGWTLEAAEAVCADESVGDVIDVLDELITRSLVTASHGRHRMLSTIRAYAEQQLDAAGEADAMARRHAEYFASVAEATDVHLRGPRQGEWLARLRADDANLRRAMEWATARGSADLAVQLGGALGWYWYVGRQVDGTDHLRTALRRSDRSVAGRARALQALSLTVRPVGCLVHPSDEAARAATESAALFREAGDPARAALSDLLAAVEGVSRAEPSGDLALVARARTTLREAGDAWGAALSDLVEMEIRLHHGGVDEALRRGWDAYHGFDGLDDDWGRSAVMLHLGAGLRLAGRLEEAQEVLARAVLVSREGGLLNNLARSVVELGETELFRGRPDAAVVWIDECEKTARELGNDTLLALAMLGRGDVRRLQQDPRAALESYRQAGELSDRNGFSKGSVRARCGRAAAALDLGVLADARVELDAAEPFAEGLGDVLLLAGVLEQRARLLLAEGDVPNAQALVARAGGLRSDHARPRGALPSRDVAGVGALASAEA